MAHALRAELFGYPPPAAADDDDDDDALCQSGIDDEVMK
jgi:hypothetical protein